MAIIDTLIYTVIPAICMIAVGIFALTNDTNKTLVQYLDMLEAGKPINIIKLQSLFNSTQLEELLKRTNIIGTSELINRRLKAIRRNHLTIAQEKQYLNLRNAHNINENNIYVSYDRSLCEKYIKSGISLNHLRLAINIMLGIPTFVIAIVLISAQFSELHQIKSVDMLIGMLVCASVIILVNTLCNKLMKHKAEKLFDTRDTDNNIVDYMTANNALRENGKLLEQYFETDQNYINNLDSESLNKLTNKSTLLVDLNDQVNFELLTAYTLYNDINSIININRAAANNLKIKINLDEQIDALLSDFNLNLATDKHFTHNLLIANQELNDDQLMKRINERDNATNNISIYLIQTLGKINVYLVELFVNILNQTMQNREDINKNLMYEGRTDLMDPDTVTKYYEYKQTSDKKLS